MFQDQRLEGWFKRFGHVETLQAIIKAKEKLHPQTAQNACSLEQKENVFRKALEKLKMDEIKKE